MRVSVVFSVFQFFFSFMCFCCCFPRFHPIPSHLDSTCMRGSFAAVFVVRVDPVNGGRRVEWPESGGARGDGESEGEEMNWG